MNKLKLGSVVTIIGVFDSFIVCCTVNNIYMLMSLKSGKPFNRRMFKSIEAMESFLQNFRYTVIND